MSTPPQVEIFSHYEPAEGFDVAGLEARAKGAVEEALAHPGPHSCDLPGLTGVEVNLVDDPTIAAVHLDFSKVPGPTDVITFQHGEVFISLDTAAAKADELGGTVEREAMLYLIHALLHLNGHEDAVPSERASMAAVQEAILAKLWPPL